MPFSRVIPKLESPVNEATSSPSKTVYLLIIRSTWQELFFTRDWSVNIKEGCSPKCFDRVWTHTESFSFVGNTILSVALKRNENSSL